MRSILALVCVCLGFLGGCSVAPFKDETPTAGGTRTQEGPGRGPVLTSPPEVSGPTPGAEPVIAAPPPTPLPRERAKAAPATLSPASRALVSQSQVQRKRGDLPGAAVSLERAL